jgi:hypothetical protein
VKEFLFIILLLIVILVSFMNIKQSSWIKEGEMQVTALRKSPGVEVGESGKQDYQTSGMYKINSHRSDPGNISAADTFPVYYGKRNSRICLSGSGEHQPGNIINNDRANDRLLLYRIKDRKVLPVDPAAVKESVR